MLHTEKKEINNPRDRFFSGKRSGRRRLDGRHGQAVRQRLQVPGHARLRSHRAGFLGRRSRCEGPSVAEENSARRRHHPADGRVTGGTGDQIGQVLPQKHK